MTFSRADLTLTPAKAVRFAEGLLIVDLTDGRSLSVPLDWYPRLAHGSDLERHNWQLVANGQGIHWPLLDEDVSVEGLLAGRRSGESRQSFERWLRGRNRDS